jgi:hypothetical protein
MKIKSKNLVTTDSMATVTAEISDEVMLEIKNQVFNASDIDELLIFLLKVKRKLLKNIKKDN